MGWLDNWKKKDGEVELTLPKNAVDLSVATIVFDAERERHATYAEIMAERVQKLSRCDWKCISRRRSDKISGVSGAVVWMSTDSKAAEDLHLGKEGYQIARDGNSPCGKFPRFVILGGTDRAVLFGIGRFLREMKLDFYQSYGSALQKLCCISGNIRIISKPKYAMRQHQIAYRPKTNAYDAFTVEQMRTEILDLALFGTNAIEMIPPGIDDADQSPNFSVPWLTMMEASSAWCDRLDVDVSMWYPAFFKDYSDPDTLMKAKAHWKKIFGSFKRLDVLFVPGGDPGGRAAPEFFRVVEMQAAFLRSKFFPDCEVWVSSQYGLSTNVDIGITKRWVPLVREREWLRMLGTDRVQKFLNGVVYGPWSSLPIKEFRAEVPEILPLRNYPDLCHVQTCEMPVSTWDLTFAVTANRESVNPRPREMARIIEQQAPYTIGCGCYSEGVNDDVNKYVWTALHWGGDVEGPLAGTSSDAQLHALLLQYASLLVGMSRQAPLVAKGILALEQNWHGPILLNRESFEQCVDTFRTIESGLMAIQRKNWRLNSLLFKFYFDLFLYSRHVQEARASSKALALLTQNVPERRPWSGVAHPLTLMEAKMCLRQPYYEPNMTQSSFSSGSSTLSGLNVMSLSQNPTITFLYGKVMAYTALLYEQIGYQLSIGMGSQHRQRGGYVDLAWAPLGDVMYLNHVLSELENGSKSTSSIVRRFTQSLRELRRADTKRVIWYASFGDEAAHECPGVAGPPTQPVPVHEVLHPHRHLRMGEDPVYFTRPLTEYMDLSNDELIRQCHDGRIPRAWRSWIVPIWPRTSRFSMRFDLERLSIASSSSPLYVRITYVGKDLNRHGGDWEELDRRGMAVKMSANGHLLHDFIDAPNVTSTLEIAVPPAAIGKERNLVLSWEPEFPEKVTFVDTPLPIAELWLLSQEGRSSRL